MPERLFSTTLNNPSNKPSYMEGAFPSLGSEPPTSGSSTSSLHPTTTRQTSDVAQFAQSRMQPIPRQHSANNSAAVNPDPVPGEPGCVFIKPPFTDFPGSAEQKPKTGLTYNILAAHPDWFLDVKDFVGPNAVVYPSQLEPPRGWCPTKKKDAKDGWKEGEEPRLRCTLCRRQYAGVNAKSMWRRHVYEKHGIPMANRRETNERPSGRGGRGSNKENKVALKGVEKDVKASPPSKSIRRSRSFEAMHALEKTLNREFVDNNACDAQLGLSSGEDEPPFTDGPSFSSTPPQTPVISPTRAAPWFPSSPSVIRIPPESPYYPDMTPAFRHSPAKMPVRQPWRFNSPVKGQEIHDYTLTMLARCEASPTVRGLDVSPNELVPRIRRKHLGAFSPPREKSLLSMSPRQLFAHDTCGWDDSIQSRFDQPGWEVPTTPRFRLSSESSTVVDHFEYAELIRALDEGRNPDGVGPELPLPYAPDAVTGIVRTPTVHKLWKTPTGDYTPHTEMFINGINIGSSPCPMPGSPSPSSRSQGDSESNNKVASLPAATLLSPFAGVGKGDSRMSTDHPADSKMEIDERGGEVKMDDADQTLFWCDIFHDHDDPPAGGAAVLRTPDADDRRALNASTSSADSGYFSVPKGRALALDAPPSTSSGASQPRRATSPGRSRGRSVSNAGASGSSSGHKATAATAGLMDAILDKRTRRRKHSHSEHRTAAITTGDGEVGVTAFGSPFKMGKKTSRRDFLYSLDGDCEMQDDQPRKRRKTISGLD